MEVEKNLGESSGKVYCEIPLKLPSCNEYIRVCRTNVYKAAKFKSGVEDDIIVYLNKLPTFNKPIEIIFNWYEGNKRRDFDNIAFAKKFILDAMVKCGKLKDDNRKCVVAFTDRFFHAKDFKVILEITEIV